MTKSIILSLAAAAVLTACTAAQVQSTQANIQAGMQTATLVLDQGACDAQKAANEATAVLTAAGDAAGAAQTSQVSTVAGNECMTLAAPPAAAPST